MSVFASRRSLLQVVLISAAFLIGAAFCGRTSAADDNNQFLVLCYHSVPERYQGDPMSISTTRLVEQLEWLREQGYRAIDLNQVLAAKAGKAKLPAKSFLVTFDDGYEDFYTNVFPLLKLYKVPAVLALVGKWIEDGVPSKNETDPYFNQQRFLTWAQIQEMTSSGLIEVASHSYDLHHGILGNPQGNTQPAAVTLQYRSTLKHYETLEQRRARLRADLEKNSRLLEQHLGKRPRAMVWPYGAYDRPGIEEAARVGMSINFSLDAGRASPANTEIMPRLLVDKEMPLSTFSYYVQYAFLQQSVDPIHAIKLHLDRLYDKNPALQNKKLETLIERLQTLGVNAVVLQPYVTPGPSGLIEEVYFPNSILPMRTDLLNHVAWQLKNQLGAAVYILAPLAHLSAAEKGKPASVAVQDRRRLFKFYEELRSHIPLHRIIFTGAQTTSGIRQELSTDVALGSDLPSINIGTHYRALFGWDFHAAEQSHPVTLVDVPQELRFGYVKELTQNLPRHYVTLLSLPVAGLKETHLPWLIQKIRLLQANGVNHFVLDDDGFLDDPVKLNALRAVLSLKRNPYLGGQ